MLAGSVQVAQLKAPFHQMDAERREPKVKMDECRNNQLKNTNCIEANATPAHRHVENPTVPYRMPVCLYYIALSVSY